MDGTDLAVDSTLTSAVPSAERTDFWVDVVSSYHCQMSGAQRSQGDFRGRTIRQRSGLYQLVGWWSDPMTYLRTAHQIRSDTDYDYRLILPVSGEFALWQGDQEARLTPGTAGLMTMSRPFVVWQRSMAQCFIMTIPRMEIDRRLSRSAPTEAKLDVTAGLGRVVADVTLSLFRERDRLTRQQFDAVADRAVELLCIAVLGDDGLGSGGHLIEVAGTVRRYVREHADDPTLTGRAVATALGWSLRQVQLALQQVGTTPRELIKEERLRLARERLAAPEFRHVTITDLAHRLGFSSVSAFSTAFRKHYGLSPSEVRA